MSEQSDKAEELQRRAQKLNERPYEGDLTKGETIAIFSVFGVLAAGAIALFWGGVREEQRREAEYEARLVAKKVAKEELEEWMNAQENDGYKIYKLADGRYLTVDEKADQATHIKRIP